MRLRSACHRISVPRSLRMNGGTTQTPCSCSRSMLRSSRAARKRTNTSGTVPSTLASHRASARSSRSHVRVSAIAFAVFSPSFSGSSGKSKSPLGSSRLFRGAKTDPSSSAPMSGTPGMPATPPIGMLVAMSACVCMHVSIHVFPVFLTSPKSPKVLGAPPPRLRLAFRGGWARPRRARRQASNIEPPRTQ